MPQSKKKLDFSDLGAKVIDFSDLGATPAGGGLSPDQIAARKADLEKKGLIGPQYANPKGVDTTAGSLVPNALGTIKRGTDVVGDLLAGVGSEVFNLGLQGSRLANVVSGGRVGVPTSTTLEDIGMAPENATQKAGQLGAQALEFLLPGGIVARGIKAVEGATLGARFAPLINMAARAAMEGLATGAVGTAQTGDIKEGAKQGAIVGAMTPAFSLVGKVIKGLIPETVTNPVQRAAIEEAKKIGAPVDLATATQSWPIQAARAITDATPVVARHGQKFQKELDSAVVGAIQKFAAGTGKYEAANTVRSELTKAVVSLHDKANKAYDAMRKALPKISVQVGEDVSPIVGPFGEKFARPIMETITGATGIQAAKTAAQTIVEQIEKEIPIAQRQASPGFAALKQIAGLTDQVDLGVADSALSQLKSIVRDVKSPAFQDIEALRTRAQGIAASIIKPMSESIDKAASQYGVDGLLNTGREATREKWAVADLLKKLNPNEPLVAFDTLVKNGDKSIGTLRRVAQASPKAKDMVGEAALQGLLDKATVSGTFSADRAISEWNRLGTMTKNELFGTNAEKITNILNYAKIAKRDINPSGFGKLAIVGSELAMLPYATTFPRLSGAVLAALGAEGLAQAIYRHPDKVMRAVRWNGTPGLQRMAGGLISKQ